MFDFGNANEGQRLAISTADGPVLITAGPGTGKTFTLVQRAIYLIQECGVAPEQIMMATFTEKAAKELVTRITNELASRNIVVNVNEMYIGTFHSLCLRIIKEHLEFTRLKRNYRTLDAFDQNYTVFQNISRFRAIKDIDTLLPKGSWKMAQEICVYVNNLMEELVDPDALKTDGNPDIRILGNVLEAYKDILAENNLVDFASIQTEAYRLMKDNLEILKELQNRLQYIMIDEYQDTNYIQEQIVFLLAGDRQNICVVGDDDQGLYRFRGATIRNILEFPDKFPEGMCKIIPLVINYRSNSDIVDFYNEWMTTTDGAKFKFDWDKYRYQKKIEPHAKSTISSPAVVKLVSVDDEDEWHEKILRFITGLKDSGKLTNYNQIAFLFSSVKHERVTRLAAFLETNHINVYSPRSDMFFGREEIRIALGTMMLLFPKYVMGLENDEYQFLQPEHSRYYRDCILAANEFLTRPENAEFMKWVRHHGKIHMALKGTTDYTYSGLLYQMFEYEPFRSILGTDITAGVVDVRPARNLALLSQVIGKYEYLHRIDVFNGKTINSNTEKFFNLYLRLLYDGGINEYEDDAEYAPSGCVSFLTIHQSKGMEFPIVIVDSLSSVPRKNSRDLILEIEEKYFQRPAYEPYSETKNIDYIRDQMKFSAFSLAGELARYLNISCILTSRILRESVDGIDAILEAVNKYNEILNDVIVPGVFHALYEVKSELHTEDKELVLLKEPKDAGYYEFSAKDELVITNQYKALTQEQIAKSFHADTYCFDSKPEKECFLQYITNSKIKEVYFTGMFTANQGDLSVQYYDPESGRIRHYYPDFLAKLEDGSYQLIEVKGDNKIDDTVVKAKAAAAQEMAVASGIEYKMYAGSEIMTTHILAYLDGMASTISYADHMQQGTLSMVAETSAPYGSDK